MPQRDDRGVTAQPPAGGLPPGTRVTSDRRVRIWRDGRTALGGAPWGVVRLGPTAAALLRRARQGGATGVVPGGVLERAAADRLCERGLLHPVAAPDGDDDGPAVQVVVPAYGRPELLDRCLRSLAGCDVVVVDDATPGDAVADVVERHGVRLLKHTANRGPAAARNTGLAGTTAPVVAFLDSDCEVPPEWPQGLAALFADGRVAAVAPRVLPRAGRPTLVARHEAARSALDMGPHRALVRPGATLGFLPSAALLVRRAAVPGAAFDEDLRVGEDVDLVWRLAAQGWQVRYEPCVVVRHELRARPPEWARRRFEYGTSAAELDRRHPGRLVPARVGAWNVAALTCLALRRPGAAAVVAATASGLLARHLRRAGADPALAPVVVGSGLLADAAALGHALRREWWPLGWAALALAPASRPARAGTVAMLAPIALEWLRQRPQVDPLRYTALRLVEDAAYGSGVLLSGWRARRAGVVRPDVRWRPPGKARSRAPEGAPRQ
jgi:mycofactocin system glycosyltransferase